jgi:hypothetical protein
MQGKTQYAGIVYSGLPEFFGRFFIFTHYQELMKSVGSDGHMPLLLMMKVMI